jgi:hypothetical protein
VQANGAAGLCLGLWNSMRLYRDCNMYTQNIAICYRYKSCCTSCLRRNCLLKHVIKGKREGKIETTEDENEDLSSYRITLRKREDTGH